MLTWLRRGINIIFCGIILALSWFYATCPIYIFEEPKPFAGEKFHNPYQEIDPDGWHKCNFHAHSKCWRGLTKGKNSPEEFFATYNKLKYDVCPLSNYMQIDATHSGDPLYIPVYEHGYNIKKVHQLALGARTIVWRDYVFPQNLSQKQHIIDMLKKHSQVVALCHPGVRSGYPLEDLMYLSGYDLMEVQNCHEIYAEEWDAALSSGHQVWLIAGDDAHSVNNIVQPQRSATFVNRPSPGRTVGSALVQPPSVVGLKCSIAGISNRLRYTPGSSGEGILERLAQGQAFGVLFPINAQLEEKRRDADKVSFPVAVQVIEDSLHVTWQQKMQQINFIGDGGKLLQTFEDTDSAVYPIQPEDTYVRVKLIAHDGLVYFLNPVIRYAGDEPVRQSLQRIDTFRTFIKRAIILCMVSALGGGIVYFFRGRCSYFVQLNN